MRLGDLLPSRFAMAAGIGCAVLLPLFVWTSWGWAIAHRDMVREQQRGDALYAEIHDAQTGYRDRLTLCGASLAGTQVALDRQSRAVDEMAAAMLEQTRKAQAAVDAAQGRYLEAQQRANALLFEQPRDGETRCAAADRLILEQVR